MTDAEDAVSLAWKAEESADYYQIQISRAPGFASIEKEEKRVLKSHYDVRDLEMQSTYYWRVRAANEAGVGDWSTAWTFTPTREAHHPTVTSLAMPPDRAINQPTEIEFRWDEVAGATSYQLEISLDAFYNTKFASIEGIKNTNRFIYGLVKTYTYYWRVRAYNPAGYGPWSQTRYIIIEGLVDQDG
jgi:hypothetical protein